MKPHREPGTGFVVRVFQKDWRMAQKDSDKCLENSGQRVTNCSIALQRGWGPRWTFRGSEEKPWLDVVYYLAPPTGPVKEAWVP